MPAPLDGIRVLEIGQMIAVPAASHLLASYGASVIKIENTGTGDELRYYGSNKGGLSGWFVNANAGKRSISLDLKEPECKEILWRLIDRADVLIEGFRPGVLDRLGFSYDAVSRRRPAMVYCSSTGFGPTGPYADLPAYDPLIQSLAGWAGAQTIDGQPSLVRGMVADKIAAWGNAQAVLAALVRTARTGSGSHLQLSLLESNIAFVWPDVMMHCSVLDADANQQPNVLNSYRLYPCADGWISLASSTDQQTKRLCEALGRPEVLARFDTAAKRSRALGAWFDAIEEMVRGSTVAELVTRLRAADLPVAPVLSPDEVASDPQVQAAGYVRRTNHPFVGEVLGPRPAAEAFGEPITLDPAPRLGEHTRGILSELGYEESDIQTLLQRGLVKQT